MADGGALAERLRALVRDVPGFPRPGIVFRDITPLLADAVAFRDAVDAMAAPYATSGIDRVVGIESRGFILGAAVAHVLGAGFVPVRKQGKLPGRTRAVEYQLEYGSATLEVHLDALVRGQRVVIVDDLLATGGTAAAAAALVAQLGAELAGLSFLIELTGLQGARALEGHRYSALLKY